MNTPKKRNIQAVTSPAQKKDELSTDKRRAVLNQFIDRVEQMLAEAAFQFGGGLHGNSQPWDDGPEPDEFAELLHPWLMPPTEEERKALEANMYDVVCTRQETAYKLGILAGARLAGYSEAKLRKMAEYLVDTLR